jgi:E3 ubiquitin-protein ligase DOA10
MRGERQEMREERRETRDKRARDKRRETSEQKNKSAGDNILNCLGQNEKSADFTGKSGIVFI